MQIKTQQDIEAPIEHVFREVTDFPAHERQALRRGIDIRRLDGGAAAKEGAAWQVQFTYRGRERELRAGLVELQPPTRLALTSTTGGLDGLTTVDLVALSRNRTRVAVATELKATTLPARLLLQSLKLARNTIDARVTRRVQTLATEIEDRWKRRAGAQSRAPS